MSGLLEMLRFMLGCGTLVTIAFLVTLSLPKSELRTFLKPIVGWAMAVFCSIYVISPVDVVPEAVFGPFGLIDDLGAIATGIAAYRMATKPSHET